MRVRSKATIAEIRDAFLHSSRASARLPEPYQGYIGNDYFDAEGEQAPLPMDGGSFLQGFPPPIPAGQPNGYNATWPPTGPFRKVEAISGAGVADYTYMVSSVSLPINGDGANDQTVYYSGMDANDQNPSSAQDSAYVYTGFEAVEGGAPTSLPYGDIGFQMGHDNNIGWKVYGHWAGAGGAPGDLPMSSTNEIWLSDLGYSMPVVQLFLPDIEGPARYGEVLFTVSGGAMNWVNPLLGGLGSLSNGEVAYLGFVNGLSYADADWENLKRCNSIGQRLQTPILSADGTTVANWTGGGARPNGPPSGWYNAKANPPGVVQFPGMCAGDGAYFYGGSWGSIAGYYFSVGPPGQAQPVDSSLTWGEGNYPGGHYVKFYADDQWSWEDTIEIDDDGTAP